MSARHRHLNTADLYRLNLACTPLRKAFGACTYLVGSVERGEPYRDVDVRTILDDDHFDRLFTPDPRWWDVVCLGIGAWLTQQTGLPIDYQIQRRTEANEKHHGPRNSLGGDLRRYAGGGDGTPDLDPERHFAQAPEGAA